VAVLFLSDLGYFYRLLPGDIGVWGFEIVCVGYKQRDL
jgi:hypothetical protein